MDDFPLAKLVQLVAERGQSLAQDAALCHGLLLDYLRGGYTKHVNVLSAAIRTRAVTDLLARAPSLPLKPLCCQLADKLHDVEGTDRKLALWALESWAMALGLALTVSADGRGQFRSINEAIQAASVPMATIRVSPGVYRESVLLDRPVTIVGDGNSGDVVVESEGRTCIIACAATGTVRGLTIRTSQSGTADDPRYAIDVSHGQLLLEDCDISSDASVCVAVHGREAAPTIRRCVIRCGLFVYDGAQGSIERCDIYDEIADHGIGFGHAGALSITDGADPLVRDCNIHDSELSGVYIEEEGLGRIEGCEIHSNGGAGVTVACGADPRIRHCRIHHNHGGAGSGFVDAADHWIEHGSSGVHAAYGGKGTIVDCEIFANAGSGVLITDGRPTVRGCRIHASRGGSGVSVSAQSKGAIERCEIFANNWVGLWVTDGSSPTISDCDIFANAHAGVAISQDADPTVQRCRIRNGAGGPGVLVYEQGKVTLEGCDIFANKLAGVEVRAGGNPTIRNCSIHDSLTGCGVLVWEHGKGTFEACDIFANKLAGVELKGGDNPTIRNCSIHGSLTSCGVVVYRQGQGTLEACEIFANRAGGVEIWEYGAPFVRHCSIHGNVENGGVIVDESGKGTFEDCEIFANAVAGIVIMKRGNLTVRACRITDNRGPGVLARDGSRGTIEECHLQSNEAGAWKVESASRIQRIANHE